MEDRRPPTTLEQTAQVFTDFVDEVSPSLFRLAYAKSGNARDAEDAVQDVLTDAYRNWDHVRALEFPPGWAHRAVLNNTISRWRRKSSERKTIVKLVCDVSTSHTDRQAFEDEELWTAIRSLPDRQRDVVLLLWFEDQHVDVVAATLGCGPETVRTHWRRARAALAKQLQVSNIETANNSDEAKEE